MGNPEPWSSPWKWSVTLIDPMSANLLRRAFRRYLERYASPESDVGAAEVIFAELLSNVVCHARGPASFQLGWRRAQPTLLVTDDGEGFRATPSSTLADPDAERGRGLALVRLLSVRMSLGNRRAGGAYVKVLLPVQRAVAA